MDGARRNKTGYILLVVFQRYLVFVGFHPTKTILRAKPEGSRRYKQDLSIVGVSDFLVSVVVCSFKLASNSSGLRLNPSSRGSSCRTAQTGSLRLNPRDRFSSGFFPAHAS